jgi:transcriptional regulator with XRE-family HTH domain
MIMYEVITMSVLGDRLRELRERKGWSQKYVAQKVGLKQSSTYSNWEYGLRDPDTETLSKLADLYEETVDYLLGRETKEEEYQIPEGVYDAVVREAESHYGVNLRDDPIVESAVRDLLNSFGRMKKGTK